ncbi:MAG: nicotinate (nicotinamide) nucleotide adenylyltransferase, partial [Gammaproteobacteria bacterium]
MKPIGILGGTFDPVHHGHLRLAIECCERLALAEVRLVPLRVPPHRKPPRASPEHRLAMLKLAAENKNNLIVDDSELRRKTISYTIDTVSTLRKSSGRTPLCLLLGTDAFNMLHTWHRWQALLDYVHVVIAERPGVT